MATGNGSKSMQRYLGNFKYHVYAAYSERNGPDVKLLLGGLQEANLLVYDPDSQRTLCQFS